jgi:hypothetical protein
MPYSGGYVRRVIRWHKSEDNVCDGRKGDDEENGNDGNLKDDNRDRIYRQGKAS